MIISRTPFRVSFAGGGSDLREFYRNEPGEVLSCTISKYMFICVHPHFNKGQTLVKYSKTEEVSSIDQIRHPIVREALRIHGLNGLDISSIADVPAGTGLGSSSSFTVGLVHALSAFQGHWAGKEFLAHQACHIEMDILGEPIGKQDQYAAAYGGLNFIRFMPDDTVVVERIGLLPDAYRKLESNLMMFYTGATRSAGSILNEQSKNLVTASDKLDNQRRMCRLARELRTHLEDNEVDAMGAILHESWMYKKELAKGISNPRIDSWYQTAMAAGAGGGKLLGAGGGGFLLFYVQPEYQDAVRRALAELDEMDFAFDESGSIIIYNN